MIRDLVLGIANVLGAFSKVHGGLPATSYPAGPMGEIGFAAPVQYGGSEHQKHGLAKGVVASSAEKTSEGFFSANHVDDFPTSLSTGKILENDGGSSNMFAESNKIIQVLNPSKKKTLWPSLSGHDERLLLNDKSLA